MSIEKVANAIGAGFARVDEDLGQMGENINLVRADVDSIDVSVKSVLEHLEVLERQSTAKDKLVDDLNHCVTTMSKALGQCSDGEDILKILLGSGRREDPFELDDDDQESWDDCPEESSPEARAMANPYPEHGLREIMPCSKCDQEEGRDVDIQMEEEEKEEGGSESSLSDDTPLAMRIVKSSSGGSCLPIPGVRGEPDSPSYTGSGQRNVHSEGCPGRPSFHPYDMAKSVRDGSSFLRSHD